jgi:hypothetical protein
MSFIYQLFLGAGWAYIGHRFHWPISVVIVACFMTAVFAFYLSCVIEADRRG